MKRSNFLALRAVLFYLIITGLWIGFSNHGVSILVKDPAKLAAFQPLKGLAFVVLTSVLFFFVLRAQWDRYEREASIRKQVADDLARAEREKGNMINRIDGIVWEADARTFQFTFVSQQAERLLGYPVDQWTRDKTFWQDHLHPEDRAEAVRFSSEKSLQGEAYDFTYRMIAQDGKVVWLRDIVSVERKDGKPVTRRGIMVDITQAKHSEEELRWKSAFLEALIESSPDGLLVVDSKGKSIVLNNRLMELWKIPTELAQSNDEARLIEFAGSLTKNPEEFSQKIRFLYEHPNEVSRDEIELEDGTTLDRYSSPVLDQSGKYYGRIWACRDITERKVLEIQLRQSQKMEAIGQLAGGVAHDFNNILAVIQLQAALLKIEATLTKTQSECASEIEKAAQRASNLTRQLLLFSRQQKPVLRNLSLKDTVSNIAKMLERIVGEDIQMNFKLSPEPMVVHADPGMIDQILLNLTVNARDAMSKGGRLFIETAPAEFDDITANQSPLSRPGSFARISVTDTGTGISPEIIARIFEPFFTTKEIGRGTGLGLATVLGIVQQHEGWITVYSEVERGTVFHIYLPRVLEAVDGKQGPSTLEDAPKGTETILLVEDDRFLRVSIRMTLLRLGYTVLEASSGKSAIGVWKQRSSPIHLLLTDLVMPGGMGGRELAEHITQLDPKIRVVYSSGYRIDTSNGDFEYYEGVNFVAKPFEGPKLAQTLRNCLDTCSNESRA